METNTTPKEKNNKRSNITKNLLIITTSLLASKASSQFPTSTTTITKKIKSAEYTFPTNLPLTFLSQTNLINTTSVFIFLRGPASHLITELDYSTLNVKKSITVSNLYTGNSQIKQISDTMLITLTSLKNSVGVTQFKINYFNPTNLSPYSTVSETKFEMPIFTNGVDNPKIISFGIDDEFLISFGKYIRKFVKFSSGNGVFGYSQTFEFSDYVEKPEMIHGVAKVKDYFIICEVYLGKMVRVWLTDLNLAKIYQQTTPIYAVEDVSTIENGLDCFSEELKTCVFVFNELDTSGKEIKSHLYFLFDIEYKKFVFGIKAVISTYPGFRLKVMNIIQNTPFVLLMSQSDSKEIMFNLGVYSPEEETFYQKLDWTVIENFDSGINYKTDDIMINPNPFSVYISNKLSLQRYEILSRNKGCFDDTTLCQGCYFIDERCQECKFKVNGIYECTSCSGDKQPVKNGRECGCADGKYYLKSTDQCLDCGLNVKKCNPHDLSIISCLDTFVKKEFSNDCQCPLFSKMDENQTPQKCICQGMADLSPSSEFLLDFSNLCKCNLTKPFVIIDDSNTCNCDPNYVILVNETTGEKSCDGVCNFKVENVDINQCRKCDNIDKILCNCKGDYKENQNQTKCEVECPQGERVSNKTHECEKCPEGQRSNLEGFECVVDDDKGLKLSGSYFQFKKSLIVLKFNQEMNNPESTINFSPQKFKNGIFKQGLIFSFQGKDDGNMTLGFEVKKIGVSEDDQKSIEIEIYSKPPTPDLSVLIIPKSEKALLSSETGGVYIKNISLSIPKNESFFDLNEKGVKNIRTLKDVLLPIASILSFSSVIALSKIIQVFEYLLLIDVPLPPKVENFFALINSNILEILKIDDLLTVSEDGLDCQTEGIWAELEYSCYNWNNSSWNYVGIFLIAVIVLVFTISYQSRLKRREGRILPSSERSTSRSKRNSEKLVDAVLDKLNEFINVGLIFLALDAFLIDIGISSVLNLFMKIFGNFFEILNSCLSILTLVVYIFLIYKLIHYIYTRYRIKKLKEEQEIEKNLPEKYRELELMKKNGVNLKITKETLKTWKFIMNEIKDSENLMILSMFPLLLIRDLIISLSIVIFQKITLIQIIGVMIPQVAALIFLITERPLKSKREMYIMISREIFFSLTLVLYLIIAMEEIKNYDQNPILEILLIFTIGGIVLTAVVMVIFNLIILIFNLLKLLLKLFCCFFCCFNKQDEDKDEENDSVKSIGFEFKDISPTKHSKEGGKKNKLEKEKTENPGLEDISFDSSQVFMIKESITPRNKEEVEDKKKLAISDIAGNRSPNIENNSKRNRKGYRTGVSAHFRSEIEPSFGNDSDSFDGVIKIKNIELFPQDFIEGD